MARPSPITIGLTALLGAILCVAVWLLARSRQPLPQPAATAAAQESEDRPGVAPPPTPAPRPPESRRPPARPPAAAPAPAPVAAAAPPPPPADAGAPPRIPFDARRDVLVKTQNLRMSEADEEVFATLNLPEATRARIREINEEHRRRTERPLSSTEPRPASTGVALTSHEARQAALLGLLGNDGARQFGEQERAAVRKIRGKFRYEWGRQLRE